MERRHAEEMVVTALEDVVPPTVIGWMIAPTSLSDRQPSAGATTTASREIPIPREAAERMTTRALNALDGRGVEGGHPQDHDSTALANLFPGEATHAQVADID